MLTWPRRGYGILQRCCVVSEVRVPRWSTDLHCLRVNHSAVILAFPFVRHQARHGHTGLLPGAWNVLPLWFSAILLRPHMTQLLKAHSRAFPKKQYANSVSRTAAS